MIFSNIELYKKGWFMGDFIPSIIKTEAFEVGYHKHKAGEKTFPHYHKITTELNFIIRGELVISGKQLQAGDIWVYESDEISQVEFLSDVELMVIRWPSVPSDKYEVNCT